MTGRRTNRGSVIADRKSEKIYFDVLSLSQQIREKDIQGEVMEGDGPFYE